MLHHRGLQQPLRSSEQAFEDSFINFPIRDKRKGKWGLDFLHRREREETVTTTRVSPPRHTEKSSQASIFDNNDDQKNVFPPLFERKIHPPLQLICPAPFDLEH